MKCLFSFFFQKQHTLPNALSIHFFFHPTSSFPVTYFIISYYLYKFSALIKSQTVNLKNEKKNTNKTKANYKRYDDLKQSSIT